MKGLAPLLLAALGVFAVVGVAMLTQSRQTDLSYVVNPTVINNNSYYNITGGLDADDNWLYDNGVLMSWNQTKGDVRYLQSYTETDPQVDVLTASKWCTSNGSVINCTANAPSSSESDPSWSGNYTACSSSQKLYFNGRNLACNNDDDDPESISCGIITGNVSDLCSMTAGGGGGVPTILTANMMCVANSTANGVNCTAVIPVDTDTWAANFSSYSTTAAMNTAIGNANTSMDTYVDALTAAYNTSMKMYVDAVNGTAGTYTNAKVSAENSSMNTFVLAVNGTMRTYVLAVNGTAGTYTNAVNTSMKGYVDGKVFADAQVSDDISVYTANNITLTGVGNFTTSSAIYIGGATGWKLYVNGTGYLIAQDV